MYKILLVEDDSALSAALNRHLSSYGYSVQGIKNFRDITAEFQEFQPHLVLLDIMLPFYNGYYWCTRLRAISNVPIVFLSSAADNMNIVMAMQMGGDDFIPKPVDPDVLIAKVQAMLRRSYDMPEKAAVLVHGDVTLHLGDATLIYNGTTMDLTKNEFRILQTLMEQSGKIVSRDTLMMRLWQDDCYVEENTLTVNIARLRKKLEAAGLRDFIRTKIGCGYWII